MNEENNNRKKESKNKRIFNLQERFIEYAASIIKLVDIISETKVWLKKTWSDSDTLNLDIGYSLLDIGYSVSPPPFLCKGGKL